MHLVEITTNSGSDFNGLRRFEPSDVIIPFNNLARDWLDDSDDRRRRSGLGGILPAASRQQSDCEGGNSRQVVRSHRKFNVSLFGDWFGKPCVGGGLCDARIDGVGG